MLPTVDTALQDEGSRRWLLDEPGMARNRAVHIGVGCLTGAAKFRLQFCVAPSVHASESDALVYGSSLGLYIN